MKKAILFVFLVLSVFQVTYSQTSLSTKSKKAQKLYEDAMKNYNLRYYDLAADQLKEALREESKFIEAWLSIAEVYMDSRKDEEAINACKKSILINPDFFPGVYLNLGDLEFLNGKYSDARSNYEKYLTYTNISEKNRKTALNGLANCDFSIHAVKNPVPFNPVNLGEAINNQYDQYWPSISVDEQTFVFTLLLPKNPENQAVYGNRQEDFYISTYENDGWSKAENAGFPLNTADNEGAQTLSADGREMYFTACNRKDGVGHPEPPGTGGRLGCPAPPGCPNPPPGWPNPPPGAPGCPKPPPG
jgi:hypothetical protein